MPRSQRYFKKKLGSKSLVIKALKNVADALECMAETQRIAFINGDIMFMTNPTTRIVFLSSLLVLLGGCALSSTGTVASAEAEAVYACDADDASWDCKAVDTDPSLSPSFDQPAVAAAPQQRERVPWWHIRVRGADSTPPVVASVDRNQRAPQRQAARPSRTETQTARSAPRERRGFLGIRMRGRTPEPTPMPEPVIASRPTPAQGQQSGAPVRNVPLSTAAATTASVQPTLAAGTVTAAAPVRQPVSRPSNTLSVNPATQVEAAPPTITRTPRVVPQPSPSPAASPSPQYGDIPLDGLGRDYDFAVQLAAFTDYNLSSSFMNSYPALDLTRVKTSSRGKTFFVVIAGTFENKRQATAQSQMLANTYGLQDAYIRTVKSIRTAQVN